MSVDHQLFNACVTTRRMDCRATPPLIYRLIQAVLGELRSGPFLRFKWPPLAAVTIIFKTKPDILSEIAKKSYKDLNCAQKFERKGAVIYFMKKRAWKMGAATCAMLNR